MGDGEGEGKAYSAGGEGGEVDLCGDGDGSQECEEHGWVGVVHLHFGGVGGGWLLS